MYHTDVKIASPFFIFPEIFSGGAKLLHPLRRAVRKPVLMVRVLRVVKPFRQGLEGAPLLLGQNMDGDAVLFLPPLQVSASCSRFRSRWSAMASRPQRSTASRSSGERESYRSLFMVRMAGS